MVVPLLYLSLGLVLMLLLGQYISLALKNWLIEKSGKEVASVKVWTQFLMAGYYLVFSGYLVLSAKPLPYSSPEEMILMVLEKLGPLMLGIGSLMCLVFWIRVRKMTRVSSTER